MSTAWSSADRRLAFAAALVFGLGLALRCWGLGAESLWYDELFSWRITDGGLGDVFARTRADTGPPGHHLLLFLMRQVLGSAEWAMRLPAALLGALGVLATYVLGRRLYGPWEGLFAAVFMATLRVPVMYGQEARAYAGVLCFASVASACFVRLVHDLERGPVRGVRGAAYVLAAVALGGFHYFGVLLVALQGVAAAILLRRHARALRRLAALYALVGAAYALWVPSLSAQLGAGMGNIGWIGAASPSAVASLPRFLFGGPPELAWAAASAAVLYLAYGAATASRRAASERRADALVGAWLVVPIVVTYVASAVWAPVFVDRYLLIVAPAAYLLVARAIVAVLGSRSGRLWIAFAATVVACLYNLIVAQGYYAARNKPALRDAVSFAVERSGSTQGVFVLARGWNAWMLDYYLEPAGVTPVGATSLGQRVDPGELLRLGPQFVQSVLARMSGTHAEELWIFERGRGAGPTLAAAFEGTLRRVTTERLPGVSVAVYAVR